MGRLLKSFANIAVMVLMTVWSAPTLAQKTVQPIYEDPFDLGAGGASLTRASRDGRLYSNPALLAYGGKFHRWFGSTISLLSNKESVDTAQAIISANGGGETSEPDQFVDAVFDNPVRVGWGLSLSYLNKFFGISVFSRFEPDIRARQIGEFGLPEIHFQAESYHGAAFGGALRTPFRWLSLGVTAKYMLAAEPDLRVAVTDEAGIAQLQEPGFIQSFVGHNQGIGFDVGILGFWQSRWFDYSLALKGDDIGDVALTGEGTNPTSFKQVVSAGTAITFHTGADAIHLAVDYRDILDAYGEPMFKRVYMGTKVLLRTYIGLAAGYYHGYPSYGAEVDLIFLRVAGTYYTRELSQSPGVDPRRIYKVTLSMGI